jgi:energy-coupling factor transporter ATPase
LNSTDIICIENVTFTHPVQSGKTEPALVDINISIREGEFLAILGANGSGKSTLARHLNGLLIPTEGRVLVAGMDTRETSNLGRIRSLVGMAFQYPEDQIVATTVEEDIAFGPENLGLPPVEIRRRVNSALEATGLSAHRTRPPHLLSAGQTQRLALAGILAMQPRVIVFDEPTTMLDPLGRRMVMAQLNEFHRQGTTVILITHHMDEAAQAGRIIILNEGHLAMDGTPREIFASGDLAAYGLELPPAAVLGAALRPLLPKLKKDILTIDEMLTELGKFTAPDGHNRLATRQSSLPAPKKYLIEVENLGHVYMSGTPLAHRALKNVDFRVEPGGAHGLIGATGCGKSTLMQHLNGLLKPQKGRVRVGTFDLNAPQISVRQVCHLAGLIFQNPEMQFFEQYVGDEIAYGARQLGLTEGLRERVRTAMQSVGLDFEKYKDRLTWSLSGGQKRRVALASILALDPQILLLDEPTAGLDPLTRRAIVRHLQELRDRGKTLVLSSHRMGDIARITSRTMAMKAGTTIISDTTGEVFARGDLLRSAGLEPPLTSQAASLMRSHGWPLPEGINGQDELVEAIKAVTGKGSG